jgi:hypothetical protein
MEIAYDGNNDTKGSTSCNGEDPHITQTKQSAHGSETREFLAAQAGVVRNTERSDLPPPERRRQSPGMRVL